jgi:formamidase
MTTREIRIDRGRALTDQTETGHNRWHPDIPPSVLVTQTQRRVLELTGR